MSERLVYVVDDEEPIRRSTQLMLKVLGYATVGFANGALFLAQAQALAPSCVLLDMRMPEMGGIEVQHALQRLACPHAVIVMSGHGDRSVAAAAMQAGATAFLEKPFSKAVLERALNVGFMRIENGDAYRRHLQAAAAAVARLDKAERAVLACLAKGESREEIAGVLRLPDATLEVLRARVITQLEVETVPEALEIAFAAERARGAGRRD